MEDQLITFETAALAKNKSFNNGSYTIFNHQQIDSIEDFKTFNKGNGYSYKENTNVERPTQTLLQKWLREVHNIHVQPFYHSNTISTREIKPELEIVQVFAKDGITKSILPPSLKGEEFNTYEEALESGLQAALKLIN